MKENHTAGYCPELGSSGWRVSGSKETPFIYTTWTKILNTRNDYTAFYAVFLGTKDCLFSIVILNEVSQKKVPQKE